MIKAKIKVSLNKRGAPSVNASKDAQHYKPGQDITIVDLINGDMVDGIDVWYKLDNGSYVWSGGVEGMVSLKDLGTQLLESHVDSTVDSESSDLLRKITFNSEIPSGNGQGINIAVLDSGIDTRYESIKSRVLSENHLTPVEQLHAHGTNVAGVLVADEQVIKGICTKSYIHDFKVTRAEINVDSNKLITTLDDIRKANDLDIEENNKLKFDIINLSLDIRRDKITAVKPIVRQLHQQGVILVVAGGNGDDEDSKTNFHSLKEHLILVGTFWRHKYENHKIDGFKNKNNIWFFNDKITTTDLYPKSNSKFTNSSAYTSVVSGIIARHLSHSEMSREERFASTEFFITKCAFNIKTEESKIPINLKPYGNETP